MLSLTTGTPIARIYNGRKKSILNISEEDDYTGEKVMFFDKAEILPNIDVDRQILYIAGPEGSGKSTIAAQYMKEYHKLFPNNRIVIFSRVGTDQAFSRLGNNIIRIPIDKELIDHPLDILNELQDTLVLFDDCNTIQDDKLKKTVAKIMHDTMETGRHAKINVIITSHLVIPNERRDARTILNEAHSLVVFPKAGSSQQISYVLQKYFGYNKEQIEVVLKQNSRWVLVNKRYPQYMLSNTMAAIP